MHYFEEIREIYTQFLILKKTQDVYKELYHFKYNLALTGTNQGDAYIFEFFFKKFFFG